VNCGSLNDQQNTHKDQEVILQLSEQNRELLNLSKSQSKKIEKLASAYSTIKTEAMEARKAAEQRASEMEILNKEIDDLRQEISLCYTENRVITPAMSRLISRFAKQKREPNSKLAAISTERDLLEKKSRELQLVVDKLQKNLILSGKREKIADRKIAKLKDRIVARDRQIMALQAAKSESFVNYTNASEDTVAENMRLKSRILELESDVSFVSEAKSKAERQAYESMNECEKELMKIREESLADRKASASTIASLKSENGTMKEKLKKMESEFKAMKEDLIAKDRELEIARKREKAQVDLIRELRES
jgi:hypothetical protein